MNSKFDKIRPQAVELAALEHLKKNPHRLIMGKWCPRINFVIFIRFFLFIQGIKIGTKAWISSKICRVRTQTVESAALEGQKLYGYNFAAAHTFKHEYLGDQMYGRSQSNFIRSIIVIRELPALDFE